MEGDSSAAVSSRVGTSLDSSSNGSSSNSFTSSCCLLLCLNAIFVKNCLASTGPAQVAFCPRPRPLRPGRAAATTAAAAATAIAAATARKQ
ncbi:hypothetical protein Emed_005504 [Eimeria media]